MGVFGDLYLGQNPNLKVANSDFTPLLNEGGFAGSNTYGSLSGDYKNINDFIRLRLGEPVVFAEIVPQQIAACFEEANMKFSSLVSAYFIRGWAASLLGLNKDYTQFDFQNSLPKANSTFTNAFMASIVSPYDAGNAEKRRAYFNLSANVERYDIFSGAIDANSNLPLEQYVASVSGYDVHILTCYYGPGYYINKFYDPLSNQQFLHSEFGFPSYGSDTVFYLNPLWEDIQRGDLLKTSDLARKPSYRWSKHYRTIEITPRPTTDSVVMWMDYYIDSQPGTEVSPLASSTFSGMSYLSQATQNVATNLGNVPVSSLSYSNMNDMGRSWVKEYTYALCCTELGEMIRNKYQSGIPIPGPNGESLTLNGSSLAANGEAKRAELITFLVGVLEQMDPYVIIGKERQKMQDEMEILKMQPFAIPIYIA